MWANNLYGVNNFLIYAIAISGSIDPRTYYENKTKSISTFNLVTNYIAQGFNYILNVTHYYTYKSHRGYAAGITKT